ncbi:hypothetical protein TeGR_g1332 [Tetraparma gracilis]|uniref:SGNH hydrolase-type esterase domain-containing protein n=1 Tax=Tetraparma gracilis TaxID=2962635 RepID=A0ABQ6MMZ4_9STRA|nr:hypothetical protein TeGR_g1332 [Tetraparma gracilis]
MKSSAVLAAATLTTFASASAATRIACVGDSITAGSCSSGEPAFYPSQLQDLLDAEYGSGAYNVTNFGESGATMQKKGDSPYWERASFPKLVAETWDIVVIMLGTNDAKDEGSGGPSNWQHDCATLADCVFAEDYKSMIDTVRSLGNPDIYIMVPPPLMEDTIYGMNSTVINSVYPSLIPAIQADNKGVLGPIDIFSALGGVADWTSAFPDSCSLDSPWAPCSNFCDEQSCDQCHPNDDGYAALAKAVQAGLGL